MPANTIKVIVFDLGNVILPFDFNRFYTRLGQYTSASAKDISAFLLRDDLLSRYEEGQIGSSEFFNRLKAEFRLDITLEQFGLIWGDIFTEDLEVCRLIRQLRPHYRLLLLSNTNELHFEYILSRYKILEQFDEYILSYRLSCQKPQPRIFQETIRRANAAPGQIIYTDDRLEFVQAACAQGIIGIHFTGAEQLKQALIQEGISEL